MTQSEDPVNDTFRTPQAQRERITARARREHLELKRIEDAGEAPFDPLSNYRLVHCIDEIKSAIFLWE